MIEGSGSSGGDGVFKVADFEQLCNNLIETDDGRSYKCENMIGQSRKTKLFLFMYQFSISAALYPV